MIDEKIAKACADNFNMHLNTVKEEIRKSGSFEQAIKSLGNSRKCIDVLQHIVNQMKQEEHDLTQDVYNKFKEKGYKSTIRFT